MENIMMWDSDVRSNVFLIQHTVISLIISTLSVTTFHRNMLWKDELSLWKDVAIKSPHNPRGHNNLGNAYKKTGDRDSALIEYELAVKLNPSFSDAHNNLGVLYRDRGLLNEAIKEYKLAARYSSTYYKKTIYENLGTVLAEKGLIDEAINSFKEALKIDPANGDILYNIGFLYAKTGLRDIAIRFYTEAVRVNPDDLGARQ
ncbi:MAG: tetratricopeptide repeat protein [Deltaproteobacteria bacterium]|nr:tetratricopeptide repeat protein [Deltaproteobacteria bacterium]